MLRTRLRTRSAGWHQSIRLSSLVSLGAQLTPAALWGRPVRRPASSPSTVSTTISAPSTHKRASSSPAVSAQPMAKRRWSRICPASMRGLSWNVVMPVSCSPLAIAQIMGAAPRYAGKSEGCRLIEPRRGMASRGRGRIEKATTTKRSGVRAASVAASVGSLIVAGCSTSNPSCSACSLTGGLAS